MQRGGSMRRLCTRLVIVLVLVVPVMIVAAPSGRSLASSGAAGRGQLHVVGVGTGGLLELYSPALGGTTHIVVMLPQDYKNTQRRYPVLYLLSGYMANYGQWLTGGLMAPMVRPLPLIVVLSDSFTGWFTNPISGTGPRWEDYDIDELIPFIDTHYRTIANRGGRAVAGLSMGGFGAFEYAARHPDVFAFAGSFSGSLSLDRMKPPPRYTGLSNFGDPNTDGLYWDGHNPVDLASNLHGVNLYLASGNGQPGPLDGNRHDFDYLEQESHEMMMDMVAALQQAGVPATVDDYGPGTHGPQYWMRDLSHALPLMMATFAHPPAQPAPWSYRTTDDRFMVWGYHGVRTGAPPNWTILQGVSRFGLTVAGTGLLTLTTAPLYPPGASYVLTGGATRQVVQADAQGRLRLQIELAGLETPIHLALSSP